MKSPVQTGDVVAGKYRVDRVLGEGGMGVVVAATHEQLDQRVALKFLLPELVSSEEVVRRFMREARAAVKIHSEHVARVLDVGTTESGTPYMVMEYLDGEDLERALAARGPLPIDQAVGFVLEACEAIAEAHSLGIVHRDLKPANLFLARRPAGKPIVKVLDFGISKVPATHKDGAATSSSALMGSPLYMSPEQMTAANAVDVRTDIWCLGVVLYEILSGKLPFDGDSMPALVFNVVEKPHTPLQAVRPDAPAELQAVIDRCLAKKPDHRFANVAELARALAPFGPPRSEQSVERIVHVLGFSGVPPPMEPPRGPLRSRPEGRTFSPTTSQPSAPRARALVVPFALVVVAAAAAGGFIALRGARHAATPGRTAAPPAVSTPVAAVAPPEASTALLPPLPVETAGSSSVGSPTASSAVPRWTGRQLPPSTAPVRASAVPAPSASTPTCHVVSYFDADGNKHFKQECK